MNLVSIILQGNLVKDASFTKFLDNEKAVFNFVIACNLSNDKVFYAECSYWINYKENQENKQKELFANNLKKGTNITIQSEYLENIQSQGQDGTKYNNCRSSCLNSRKTKEQKREIIMIMINSLISDKILIIKEFILF